MTPRQKIEVRLSEVRTRLNTIAGLEGDDFTAEIRTELDALKTEYGDLEVRHQAAIIGEGDAEARARGEFGPGDGEAGERGRLLRETTIGDYLGPASVGGQIEGRAKELNAAFDVEAVGKSGGVAIPWAMLATRDARQAPGPVETRAFTTTTQNDGPEMQRPILQRLFGPGIMDTLGVRVDTVPAGRAEWPLIAAGVAPAQVVEGTAAAAAVSATFNFANLKPKRLTGRYEFTHELAASVADVEQALRRDLADSVQSAMSNQIVNGAAVDPNDDATAANVQGFLSALGTASDLSTAEAAASDYGRLHSLGVDAVHAGMETEVSSIVGDETYQHAAGVYIAGSGEAGSELLRRRSGGCIASTYIPDAASMKQSAILHAAGPNGGGIMRGDSVAAMWPTLEVIRDIYTQASQGVVLTWVALWDAKVAFRSAAYKHIAIQIAS